MDVFSLAAIVLGEDLWALPAPMPAVEAGAKRTEGLRCPVLEWRRPNRVLDIMTGSLSVQTAV